ncbi:MAG TPA: hypothetical protein VG963_04425 [Polyangiaceae bacterium]|nr:hypothetical protein [Polyangiaceae bacterium]
MRCAAVLLAAGLLTGCGSKEAPSNTSAAQGAATKRTSAAPSKANATAEEVAREARGKVKCPAPLRTAGRKPNAPVDDVVGVRPGLTYDEAVNVVLCSHELLVAGEVTHRNFQIQTYGEKLRQGFVASFAKPRVQKNPRDFMKEMQAASIAAATNRARPRTEPGQSRWYVATIGAPGEERVVHASREEVFEQGRNPTMESVEQALIKKYGTPTISENGLEGSRHLRWAYDPLGQRIPASSPLNGRCRVVPSPDAATSFSTECGLVVAASVTPLRENPALGRMLQVAVIDQAGGYEAITGTERLLEQREMQRRWRQVEEAAKNAAAPTL